MTALPTIAQRGKRPPQLQLGCAALLLYGGFAVTLPSPATALNQACGPRDMVVSRLAETYGETRQSMGLGNNNAVMELFASGETGSWTITVTSANGVTCLIASGLAFETLAEPPPPKESDA